MLTIIFTILTLSVNLELSYQQTISGLHKKIEGVDKKYDILNNQVITINNDIKNIWELMFTNEALRKENDQLRNNTTNFNKVMTKATSDIATLLNEVNILKTKYEQLADEQNNWVSNGGYKYKLVLENLSWMDAMKRCKAITNGLGYLTEIRNGDEEKFVNHLVQTNKLSHENTPYWLGGCDIGTEGSWRWCGSETNMNYTNWSPNQPNNHDNSLNRQEHCLSRTMITVGWNDNFCGLKSPFICEKKI